MVTADETLFHDRRHRRVIELLVQGMFELRVASSDRVANYYDIGAGIQILGAVAVENRDPELLKLYGHWRINVFIRAGDPITSPNQHAGKRRHSGSANSYQVVMPVRQTQLRWELRTEYSDGPNACKA